MQIADDWPGFAEELGRKSLETVHKWMTAHQAGRINLKELYILVDGIYDTVSGIAKEDDLRAIEAVHQGILEEVKNAKRSAPLR